MLIGFLYNILISFVIQDFLKCIARQSDFSLKFKLYTAVFCGLFLTAHADMNLISTSNSSSHTEKVHQPKAENLAMLYKYREEILKKSFLNCLLW